MTPTPTICNSALCGALLLWAGGAWAQAAPAQSADGQRGTQRDTQKAERFVRPEGYLQIEGDDGGASPRLGRGQDQGTFSVIPPPPQSKRQSPRAPPESPADGVDSTAPESGDAEAPADLTEAPRPPPRKKTAREICQPIQDRFALRLAELRGDVTDAGAGGVLDPAIQRAMFGRVALQDSVSDIDANIPELTWDSDLKDLQRTYRKCLKAERRR